MSRAFVKETDGDDSVGELPDRLIGPERNLVTARGLARIEAEVARLRAEFAAAQASADRTRIAQTARDLRYWAARQASAELVPPPDHADEVRFGLAVTIERNDGRRQRFRIVGLDEADPAKGSLSYAAPLARALTGKRIGDTVPAGTGEAEIVAIEVPADDEP
ncbi:transcription elongation factor GreA [Desertibaculum subflavum]|uniref:transcription elongation factor GreA n=1 Tax=Desertibaculum subflavum TaxID=2268458 RepID=UPI000E663C43